MNYDKRLPDMAEILRLSTLVRPYPTTRREVVRVARMWNFPESVVSLVRQFPADEVFDARIDLVNRCNDLASLIRHQWQVPRQSSLNL